MSETASEPDARAPGPAAHSPYPPPAPLPTQEGPRGIRFTLSEAWTALLLDDARVIHETTPIQPDGARGWRDTLVLTYRRGGFQSPVAA